ADRGGLALGGQPGEERVERGRRYTRDTLCARVLEVEVGAGGLVPEVAVDGRAAPRATVGELARTGRVAGAFAALAEGAFEPEEQTVQVGRHDLGRVDGRERAPVGEPAGAEVPAALRRGADIPVQLARNALTGTGQLPVLAQRLLAWRVAIVPVPV